MSSPQRRAELRKQYEEEDRKQQQENARKESLSMWERIEEADISGDLRDILHRIAEQCGLEN